MTAPHKHECSGCGGYWPCEDRLGEDADCSYPPNAPCYDCLVATRAQDQREVERLRAVEKAAQIFAKLNIEHLRDWPDDRELWDCGGTMLRVGHVRTLRDALTRAEGEK